MSSKPFRLLSLAALFVAAYAGAAAAGTHVGLALAPPVPVYNPSPAYIPAPVPAYPPSVALPPPVAPLPPQVTYFTSPVVVPVIIPDRHGHR